MKERIDKETYELPFEKQKILYFFKLGLEVRKALEMHKAAGLWEKEDRWGNISKHCLLETARVRVFANMLNLSEDMAKNLKIAAALHDFFKKQEKKITANSGWDSFEKSSETAESWMRKAGFNESIIRWINRIEDVALPETEKIVMQKSLSEDDIASIVLHYVDDYTTGDNSVQPIEIRNGGEINDLDRRIEKLEENPKYALLNEEGKKLWGNETAFQAQRRVAHLIEKRLAALIRTRTGKVIEPEELPTIIDEEIKAEIDAQT